MKADKSKLEKAMARACMDTADIARMASIPRPTLNNVITGRSVRPATIGRVAKALGVDIETIMKEEA